MVPAPRPKTSFEHYARTIELKARDAEFYMDEGMNFTAVEAIRAIEGMKFEAATQRERTVPERRPTIRRRSCAQSCHRWAYEGRALSPLVSILRRSHLHRSTMAVRSEE